MSLRARSLTEVKMPRATTSRSILANQSSTWLSQRGIGRGEVQVHLGMISQELRDQLGFMRREVVGDDVDFPMAGFEREDLAQESDELFGGVAGGGLTHHLATFGIERGVERERAMAVVLKPWRSARPGLSGSTGSSRSSA